jgi:hypothetical protein
VRARLLFTAVASIAALFVPLVPAVAAPAPPAPPTAAPAPVSLCEPTPGSVACMAEEAPVAPAATPGRLNAYGPADLKAAYDIPASTTNATVAIVVAYAAPSVEADLGAYRAFYGLPACTIANGCLSVLNQRGAASPLPTTTNAGWETETALDVQMVSAVCPSCRIMLMLADSDNGKNMHDAVLAAVAKGAQFVSMSWGAPEFSGMDRFGFDTPGVAFVAASGDNGYGTAWPAVDSNVVSVGGTSLTRSTTTARGFTEKVWGTSASNGTGSGCSAYVPKPSWQTTSLCGSARAMNDVAVVGDPSTGVAVYLHGSWRKMGGTSAGAPIVAAMYALAGSPSTTVAPPSYPYANRSHFLDITQGSNGDCGSAVCNAASGWDGPTGVGVPQGVGGFRAGVAFRDYTLASPFGVQVYRLAGDGIIGGWADGTFRPSRSVSRQAFASFLAGVVNTERPGSIGSGPCLSDGASAFPDVSSVSAFCRQIRDLASAGVINGYADGGFRPDAPISRQAMAALMHRVSTQLAAPAAPASSGCAEAPFSDVGPGTAFCADIAWMKDAGISTGFADGAYRPTAETTREATAAFLARLLDHWRPAS